ncbi:MAG: HD domain-containing protein [Candidatus Dojkabacteria bacterium]
MSLTKTILKFIYELGMLRRVQHEGYKLAGVNRFEINSVAEHSLRAAQIAFILGHMEGYSNPHELCSMLVFHDMDECRIGDLHKVAKRYISLPDKSEIVEEQTHGLGEAGAEIKRLYTGTSYSAGTQVGDIAKDADYLEQAFTAKEYLEKGYEFAQDWINNVEKALHTQSAKELLKELEKTPSSSWWEGLKKLPDFHQKP